MLEATHQNPVFFDVVLRAGGALAVDFTAGASAAAAKVLEPGQKTTLCVLVTDAELNDVKDATVSWSLEGSGALEAATTLSDEFGSACVVYDHPATY